MKYVLVILMLVAWPLAQVRSAELTFVEKVIGDPEQPLPLLIAIHGLGDTPERFSALFERLDVPVRLVVPRAPDAWPVGTSWFPIDDRKRAPGVLLARARQLADFARELTRTRKVRGLPIVTGFSQGGCLSYALAAYHSEAFSAALPVAGLLPAGVPAYRKARADFRVIAFHGDTDTRIPAAEGRRTTAALERAGTRATLTTYARLGHGFDARLTRDYFAALREELDRAGR